ncbi:MAG: serine/threonine-protein kinase, partial [Planctomycetota bacterium]|nr:serine/threonine-protein kinase [Planctomycetota bacterium]
MPTPSYSKLPAVGASIDGYKIQSLLGRGGMGAVYKAQKNGADYALKLMLNFRTEVDYKRFEREAHAVASVDLHPNIARIHHFGRWAGNAYMVFDYIAGGSLEEYLQQHPKIPIHKALRICMGIADALNHIHSKGIIHRDLKPANILLDDEGRPLLSDFGLVKQFQVETLTKTNETVGTPKYMAPEQMRGKGVGPPTDIWALGVLLFETLTQSLPFEGESAVEIGHQVVFNPPIQPRLLRNDLPDSVEQLILICLEKDPKQRYQSAANFKSECQRILEGQDLQHRELSPRKKGSRIKQGFLALFLLLLLAALAFFFLLPAFEKQQFIDDHSHNVRHAKITLKNARNDFELYYVQQLLKLQGLLPKDSQVVTLPKDLSKRVTQMGQLFVASEKSASLLDQRQTMIPDSQIRELRWWLVLQKTCDGKKLGERSLPSRDERSLRGLWQSYKALANK